VVLRERMLMAFEEAEREHHPLTFVIVGGGPTGVELAGALAEIGRKALGPDFRTLRLEDFAILLVEAGPRILSGFSSALSARATVALQRMGVTIKLNSPVTEICPDGLTIGKEVIRSTNIIWAAGNKASPLLASLGVPQDASGRVTVLPDLTIPGDANIFVIGDAARCLDAKGVPLPALAPVAMQQGRYVAGLIRQGTLPAQRKPFVYADRGMLATIGRAQAVAQLGSLHFAGLFAWLLWCLVHIFFLIGFRNRIRVMLEWMWYYVTFKPGARVIYNLAALAGRGGKHP
jgi:NADH:ubiquinone reductase (H+-translocating)